MKRLKPTKQIYENYTAEDFAVWEVLFNRQMNALATSASADYLQAVKSIGFTSNEIPLTSRACCRAGIYNCQPRTKAEYCY